MENNLELHPFERLHGAVKRASRLTGEHWDLPLRVTTYKIASIVQPRVAFKIKGYDFDIRINYVLAGDSSSGTANLKYLERRICEISRETIISNQRPFIDSAPTNEEQLVGTVNRIQKKGSDTEYNPVPGEFAAHNLFFDDCDIMFCGTNDRARAMRHRLLQAADTIGRSPIHKCPTGVPEDYALEYCPQCNITIRIHPKKNQIPQENIRTGVFKRFLSGTVDTPEGFEEAVVDYKFGQLGDCEEQMRKVVRALSGHDTGTLCVLPEIYDSVAIGYIKSIQRELRGLKSGGYVYLKDVCGELFLKLAVILAKSRGSQEISEHDMGLAAFDATAFLKDSLEFWDRWTSGSGLRVKDYDPISAEIRGIMINHLRCGGHISKETSTCSMGALCNVSCKKVFGEEFMLDRKEEKDKKTYDVYDHLKKEGRVGYAQDGQHDSKVWLNP